jgi:hypothetical protein
MREVWVKDEDEWRWGTQCPVTDVTYLPFPLGEGCVILRAEAVPKTQTSDWMWLFSSLCDGGSSTLQG